jgi:hypothetical protein
MALLGCTTTKPVDIQLVTTHVPKTMRTCRDAPPVPVSASSQKEVAAFLPGLAGAHLDCKEKLSGVIKILDKAEAEAKRRVNAD